MAEWSQMVMDYMVYPKESTQYCKAAYVTGWDFSQGTDVPAGTMPWACASQPSEDGTETGLDTDAAWTAMHAADQDRMIMQDDGSEVATNIVELKTVVSACKHNLKANGPLAGGIWIGGVKHSMTHSVVDTDGGVLIVDAVAKGEKGCQIVCTDPECKGKACIIVAQWDKGANYTAAMARTVAVDFAKWLKEQGTDKSF